MPRDWSAEDERTLLPNWAFRDRALAAMLPYVSLVDDATVRTGSNELFQCLRLEGLNSATAEDALLERSRSLFAAVVAQAGQNFSFYVHKVSKEIDTALPPVPGDGFAARVDERWQRTLGTRLFRDRTLTLTVIARPRRGGAVPLLARRSIRALKEETERRMRSLREVVAFVRATFAEQRPRPLTAASGELLGFLGSLNTGREHPIRPGPRYNFLAQDVANTRVTFRGPRFELSEGVAGRRYGTSFAVKNYPPDTWPTMLDELDMPVDLVVTHSFTPINSTIMAGRIRRQQRLRRSVDDGARSLMEQLAEALDELESRRLIFGDHHMTVTVFADHPDELDAIAAEVRNTGASVGAVLVNEAMAARTHYFGAHPGNGAKRSRKAAITNINFADLAALHRAPLGKEGGELPWGVPITVFPTPGRSAFQFSHHEEGSPEAEPTSGHTIIVGRSGSGKSVLAGFLATQAKRVGARVLVLDYRRGMEMATCALGGRYAVIAAGEPTGLNPLAVEIDRPGQDWLADWLGALIEAAGKPLTPIQSNLLADVVRQNAEAGDPRLRNWADFAALLMAADDGGDLHERVREWADGGRFGWVFGRHAEDSFSLEGETVGFDLTGILDSESPLIRQAVLSYVLRRVERVIEDRRPTVIVVDEAWKALDNPYFAERLGNWLVTARKQNAVVVMMTQHASQLERTAVGRTIVEAVPTQILLPNVRAKASDYDLFGLDEKELEILLTIRRGSRVALVRDDRGSVLVNTDLSALGPLLTILGGLEAGERLAGADYRGRPEFWREVA